MKKSLFIFLFLLPLIGQGQIIATIAGNGLSISTGDGGPATSAGIGFCSSISVDPHGNIYIISGLQYRIRKVDVSTGIISTVAGTGVSGYNGDGIPATSAMLKIASYIAVDSSSNLYISDAGNSRIRKVNASTGIISTIVGNGIAGYSGDGGQATAAKINDHTGIAIDSYGNLYINDNGNNRVRKVDMHTGIISTVAGNGVSSNTGDGGIATAATVHNMLGICTDRFGNIYTTNDSGSIRKINVSTGVISRVAGKGNGIGTPYLGDGIPATNSHIGGNGVAVDSRGNIYISDGGGNSRIEKVNSSGIITTVTGTGTPGFSGDGGIATTAQVSHPENVIVDKCDNIYIADFDNARVRKVTFNPPPCTYLSVNEQNAKKEISIYPNPANDVLHIDNAKPGTKYDVVSIVGAVLHSGTLQAKENSIPIRNLPPGIYMLALTNEQGIRTVHKIIKE